MPTRPYLWTAGSGGDTLHIRRSTADSNDYWIDVIDNGLTKGGLCLSTQDMNDLAHTLIVTLYEANRLTMDTAERVEFLCSSVLADRREFPDVDRTDPDGDLEDGE